MSYYVLSIVISISSFLKTALLYTDELNWKFTFRIITFDYGLIHCGKIISDYPALVRLQLAYFEY